ncbi:hypothetical protein CA13_57900 [Planctomycetes bacterium CA13]|uniref:Uncharacterized protein n=2 Tax=Novipirellula herctigrandis TaxID=2527986 RepID=A0A5C5ZCK6_9BACT|nr:hypothetical protein CA13_57900 [Planctomycetes bacterium CA13]
MPLTGAMRKMPPFPFSFPACVIKGCSDILTNTHPRGPFTDCLEETLDEQSAFVQMEVKAAMIKLAGILQDNCNKARFKSGCCYQSKGRIKPRPKGQERKGEGGHFSHFPIFRIAPVKGMIDAACFIGTFDSWHTISWLKKD